MTKQPIRKLVEKPRRRTPTNADKPRPKNALLPVAGLLFLCLSASAQAERDATAAARSVLIVVAARDFDLNEYQQTADILTASGFTTVVASTDTIAAVATNDSTIKPAFLISQAEPERYSALILIGGVGTILLWDDSTALTVVRSFAARKGQVIGAIGLAPLLLAKAGLLKGRGAAVYNEPKAAKILADNGAKFSFRDIVADGQFITANGADAAPKFARAIVKRLETGTW
jgi:protease I